MGQVRLRGRFYQLRYYNGLGIRIEESTRLTSLTDAQELLKSREAMVRGECDAVTEAAKVLQAFLKQNNLNALLRHRSARSLKRLEVLRRRLGPITRLFKTMQRFRAFERQRARGRQLLSTSPHQIHDCTRGTK